MTLKSVVFPAPLGPISPPIVPSSSASETSSRATMPPNRRVTFSTVRRDTGRRSYGANGRAGCRNPPRHVGAPAGDRPRALLFLAGWRRRVDDGRLGAGVAG